MFKRLPFLFFIFHLLIKAQNDPVNRNNFQIEISPTNEEIIIDVSAKSFLHSQVRIMVGTLVEVGKGKTKPDEIKEILESKDRSRAGPTAPAHGLYLIKVDY